MSGSKKRRRCGSGGNRCRDVAVEGTGAEMWQWREQVQRCGSGGNRCRDVAVEGKGAEMWHRREQMQRREQVTKNGKNKEHRGVLAVVIHKGRAMCMW